MKNFYDLKATRIDGKPFDFQELKGKVVIVVNTASKCGFTYQFEGLEKLYQKYKNQELVILGFPCNQFKSQDPGSNTEIESFCQMNYGVTFPMFEKVDVKGESQHEVFQYLTANSFSWLGKTVKWNFTKFVMSPDGSEIERFEPFSKPEKVEKFLLKKGWVK